MTTPPPNALKVFLSYASEDRQPVRMLYQYLVNAGFDVWMDEKKLLPGQDWDLEIHNALHEADAVIVVFSKNMVKKEGYIQRELRLALDRSQEKPDGTIYLIPARLEECDIPRKWGHLHYIDLNRGDSGRVLIEALNRRANSLENKKQVKAKTEFVINEFVESYAIPAERIQQTELPQEYKESLQMFHYYGTRIASGATGLFAAVLGRSLFSGLSTQDPTDFASAVARSITGSGFVTVILALSAMSGAYILFHFLDIKQLEKLDVPTGGRYFLSIPVGLITGLLTDVLSILIILVILPLAVLVLCVAALVSYLTGTPLRGILGGRWLQK